MGLKEENSKTYMDDEQIVELYWKRDERALEETDFKYKKYLSLVAYNIVHDTLDCEECLNDTYVGAWNAIPPSKPNVLKAFLTTIMRRIAVNRFHHNLRKSSVSSEMSVSLSELEEFISDDKDVETEIDTAILGKVISDFIRSLSERRRFIFMSRYYVANPIDTIAKDLNVSRSKVNKELASIKNALKEKLEMEGYTL